MTSRSRRGRPGYDTETLLQVCVETFNRHGYDSTSMGMLAEALGISKSAIYYHIPSKEDLLKLALDRALDALQEVLDSPDNEVGSTAERLENVLRTTVLVLIDKLPYVTLLVRLRGNTEVERDAVARRREMDRRLARLVTRASEEGLLAEGVDPTTATRLIFGTINSIVEWYRPGGRLTRDQVADSVVQLVFHGILR